MRQQILRILNFIFKVVKIRTLIYRSAVDKEREMSVIKVDYGEIGGVDITPIIGKRIYGANAGIQVYNVETWVANLIGITEININISNLYASSNRLIVNGYIGDTKTEITRLDSTGNNTVNVSSYERLSIQSLNSSGVVVGEIIVVS